MGALSVRAMCAHGLFSGEALERIENSVLDEVLDELKPIAPLNVKLDAGVYADLLLDDVKAAMEGMLAPELREHTLGLAEIREIFRVPKVGNIAGCRVTEGLIRRSAKVRLIRDGVVFWNGELSSLKHFKDDAREIKAGNECGLSFEKFQDFKIGDIIEAFEILKEKKTLE